MNEQERTYAFDGEARTLRQIAALTGLNFYTLRSRVVKYGFTVEEAITHKGGPRAVRAPKLYEFQGQRMPIKHIAALSGVSRATAYNRRCGDRVLEGEELIDADPELPSSATPITVKGQTNSIAGWAIEIGIPKDSLYQRLRHGWTVKRAFSEPVMQPDQRILYQGNRRTVRRIAFGFRRARNAEIIQRIASTIQTGGYPQTFALPEGTGVGRHETYFEGVRP